ATATVTDPAAFAGFAGATIEFIDAGQYTIDGNGTFAWVPGTPVADAAAGWSLSLQGTPAAGDRFTLSPTPPRSTDNGNALALAALDQRELLEGGTVSLTGGLTGLTARAGAEARHASLSHEAQGAIHAQVVAERESVSGVNLEEEAADLLRYQQAYQAAAQIIATADTTFRTLLSAVSRSRTPTVSPLRMSTAALHPRGLQGLIQQQHRIARAQQELVSPSELLRGAANPPGMARA